MTHRLRIAVLGSGSAGNATVVACGETTVLVDCGLSAREVARRMSAVGFDPGGVEAILVTHEHSDHVRGIDVFARRYAPRCRIVGSPGTLAAGPFSAVAERLERLRCGEPTAIGELTALAFPTSHDAAQPVGYRLFSDEEAVGVVTDTGVLTPEAAEALRSCDVLALECNHDLEMLENGPYPHFLKRRIRSSHGHLSNTDAAAALEQLACDRLTCVIAMHRSETNNSARLAARSLENRLARIGLAAAVCVAEQSSAVSPTAGEPTLFDTSEG